MKHFYSSFIVAGIGLIAAMIIGSWEGLFIAAILSVLEVSLSFDNAVVNAKVLTNMSAVWRHRFITWGMLIAVFGMRLVFPVLIVSIVGEISMLKALSLATLDPDKYKEILTSAHVSIMGFGGSFLFLVSISYFFDEEKDVHWIQELERNFSNLGGVKFIEYVLTLLIVSFTSLFIRKYHGVTEVEDFNIAAIFGILTYASVQLMEHVINKKTSDNAVKAGLGGFLYLELLDASFSFDGVIGAFALTNNMFIIMIGLGIGAMFVRSLTLKLVDSGTLAEYRYLEHGAFYAIFSLASIMFINTIHEIPEVVTGLIGALFIGLALMSSVKFNRLQTEIH